MTLNGIFMATVLPVSWVQDSGDFNALLISSAISANVGIIIWYFTRSKKKELSKRDGYLIVTLGWIILGITGSLPFILSGNIGSFASAFFETMSGYTTTGASILNDIESLPAGIMLWRSMTQWIGGMGMIVLTVALLPLLGVGGMQLFMAEAPGPSGSKIHPKIGDTAKRLWIIYVLLTAVETILLKIAGMTWLDAVNHSFTTMSTGGFSTKNASVAAFNSPAIEYIITAFMLVGGINFSMLYFIVKGVFSKVIGNEEFKTYIGIIVVFTLLISGTLYLSTNQDLEESFLET